MDTREKIISANRVSTLLQDGSWRVITGVFDPLTKDQALRIASQARNGSKLLVAVEPGADCFLDDMSRAKLVAALRLVDAVVIASKDEQRSLIPAALVVDRGDHEDQRTAEFVQFVLDRQQSSTTDKPAPSKTSR